MARLMSTSDWRPAWKLEMRQIEGRKKRVAAAACGARVAFMSVRHFKQSILGRQATPANQLKQNVNYIRYV